MLFNSPIFLTLFLPFVLLLYYLGELFNVLRLRDVILLLASLIFYAWGENIYVLLMLSSITINYVIGMKLCTAHENSKNTFLFLGIAINLAILGYFKYASFLLQSFGGVINSEIGRILLPDHLPIGLSFFTFQAISYIIDVRRGDVKGEKNFVYLAMYISLFPQLIAGPIVRYRDIRDQIKVRQISTDGFVKGIRRFIVGLAKKVLIADTMAVVVDRVFSIGNSDMTSSVAWIGAIAFTFEIYFDFSGYSDMAIGLGKMLGFNYKENFNYPYISRSVREFWRRWHISLSTWFRDYLYYPLGGNQFGKFRTYINLLIVFALCGLWHGASWIFLAWGLYHGLFLMFERTRVFKTLWEKFPVLIQVAYTLLITIVGWVLFRSSSFAQAIEYLSCMFLGGKGTYPLAVLLSTKVLLCFCVATIASLPIIPVVNRLIEPKSISRKIAVIFTDLMLFIFLCMAYMEIVSVSYRAFEYFRF
jgi:alginate O-acetyltransferase complex protein AlgI